MPDMPMLEDCTCKDCPKCKNNWVGDISLEVTTGWETGMCFLVHISWNEKEDRLRRGSAFYVNGLLCDAEITAYWGNNKKRTIYKETLEDGRFLFRAMSNAG